jgi:CRISPR/Cas system CSM-associated protein Csm2 small subunit
VRPLATYTFETWVLKENINSKLRVFERKVLRRIYGPTKESNGTWRIKSNDKLNRLIGNKNIINCIKARRLAWFGHVHCMQYNSMVRKVYEWAPALTRSLERPKNRWEDDVKSDITKMKITNWKDSIRNQPKWKEFVEKAKTSLKL